MHDAKFAANYALQSAGEAISFPCKVRAVDKLHDRQSADGNNEMRLQNPNLIIHPRRTVANLIRRRDAVGAAGIFAGEAAADGGEIDLRSDGGFVHPAKLFEPTEECFAGSVRKRLFQRRLARTGRLPNDHHVAHDHAARDRCRLHARAAPATQKRPDMFVESVLGSCCSHGSVGRSHMARQLARSDGPQARCYSVRSPNL